MSAQPSPVLLRALRAALRPLVRLMMARGLALPQVVELLKSLMVEVAETDFRLGGGKPSDSRISLLSGVHRKDVSRLRQQRRQGADAEVPGAVSRGAQIASLWLSQAPFLDEQGRARPLSRHVSEGGEVSFEALVARVSTDIRSRVVLDEWLRLGLVRIDEQGRVCLLHEAFVPTQGADEKAYYLGSNLHSHATAAVHNLLELGEPMFERCVHYGGLSEADLAALERRARELASQALRDINREAQAAKAAAPGGAGDASGRSRLAFGIYFCRQTEDETASTAAGSEPT